MVQIKEGSVVRVKGDGSFGHCAKIGTEGIVTCVECDLDKDYIDKNGFHYSGNAALVQFEKIEQWIDFDELEVI